MIQEFLAHYGHLVSWIALISTCCFVASLVIIPWIICRLSHHYFLHLHEPSTNEKLHPILFTLLRFLRYLLGIILLAAGFLMLFLPGQGLLTMILGLSLLDFPGKRRAVDTILELKSIRRGLNWIREKGHKEPFLFPNGLS